jgi:catechol 2,3-dioxygenase-like lactoylglutathione lyase family enzyme
MLELVELEPPIPVLRIFDAALARAFYVDWLGFEVDWEVQAGDGPRYLRISPGPVVLHLSEHYGDCSPGAKVVVNLDDVDALHRELHGRPNPYMNPGVELVPWNAKVMEVIDPFGNRICFNQPLLVVAEP